jgi:hypothetical protein
MTPGQPGAALPAAEVNSGRFRAQGAWPLIHGRGPLKSSRKNQDVQHHHQEQQE